MVGQGQGLRSSASLAILCGFSFLAVSALVVEDDLLMVESQNAGPAIAILPPPPEMIAEDDDQLMMESREAKPLALASPERSAVDQHQFVMAANYLKNQFSIPHHLVPSYQDISRRSGLMKRRLDNLPNIENHRFNPEISPYDIPEFEELKKNPEEYKNANIYRMDNQVSSSSHQRNTIHRRKFDVKPPPRTSDSGYRRSKFPPKPPKLTRKFDSPGLLSSLLSPFNSFRSRPEPENTRKFGAIPDKFRYPLPREHHQAISDRRPENGQRRRGHGFRVSEKKPFREVLKNKIENKYEPDPPSNRKPINVEKREPVKYKERRRLQRKPEASIRKNLDNSLLRKRVSPPRSGGRRSDDKELVWRSKEDIDGLDLGFWVDEADQSSTAKPDYRRRWRNLTQEYEEAEPTRKTPSTIARVDNDPLDERVEVIEEAEAVTKSQERPLFHDWGDSLWDEIQEDWGEDDLGENKFSALSARYLNAWADVARIGTAAARKTAIKETSNIKIPAIKSQTGTGESQSRRVEPVPSPSAKMLNVNLSDNVVAPPRRHPPSQYINRRRPIKRTRL